MTEEIKKTIISLESKLTKKETEYIKRKQSYEAIIKALQDENQRLKMLLANSADGGLFDSSSRLLGNREEPGYVLAETSQKNEGIVTITQQQYGDLLRENTYLKNQISELSSTYQKQIEQLTYYFEKIKHQNSRLLPSQAHYAGKINYLENAYKALMKDYHRQKQKYKEKLLQYASQLQLYQEKLISSQEQAQFLEGSLREKQETIKILKRIK